MKCALLIGINYTGTSAQLSGCINDINNIYDVLKKIYKYKKFIIIHDKTEIKPTKENIISQLNDLIQNSHKYEEIWIHYSGHGKYIRDRNGDEIDKKDECIVPLDYENNGYILDDEINTIVSNTKCQTRIILDCCHSGTAFDLEYNILLQNEKFVNVKESKKINNSNSIYMLSGCKDNQTSKESFNPVTSKVQGALTYNLSNLLKKYKYNISIKNLLLLLNKNLSKFDQNPVFSSISNINTNSKFMVDISKLLRQKHRKEKLEKLKNKRKEFKKQREQLIKEREQFNKQRLENIKKKKEIINKQRLEKLENIKKKKEIINKQRLEKLEKVKKQMEKKKEKVKKQMEKGKEKVKKQMKKEKEKVKKQIEKEKVKKQIEKEKVKKQTEKQKNIKKRKVIKSRRQTIINLKKHKLLKDGKK
jgi:hypothetical protein